MHTASCRTAVERLLSYLEDPDLHQAEIDLAIDHIRECSHCKRKIGYLVRVLTIEEEDALTCGECQALLPDYLQAKTDQQAHQALWRPIALHLETCPYCSAEYATLSSLAALAYGEQGAEPPYDPVPDLSFLRKKKGGVLQPIKVPWHLDELGHLVIRFSTDLVQALQLQTDQMVRATAGLKSDKSSRILFQTSLEEAVEDLEVIITAEERQDDPTRCTVIVEANILSRGGWPNLAGTEVKLKRDEFELETQVTDAFGQTVFEGVPTADLARLIVEIAPGT